jgi:hypothetical protein
MMVAAMAMALVRLMIMTMVMIVPVMMCRHARALREGSPPPEPEPSVKRISAIPPTGSTRARRAIANCRIPAVVAARAQDETRASKPYPDIHLAFVIVL